MKPTKSKCKPSMKENLYNTDMKSKVVQIYLKDGQTAIRDNTNRMDTTNDKGKTSVIDTAIKNQCIAESEVEELLVQNQKLKNQVEQSNKLIKTLQAKISGITNEHNQLKIHFLNLEKENCQLLEKWIRASNLYKSKASRNHSNNKTLYSPMLTLNSMQSPMAHALSPYHKMDQTMHEESFDGISFTSISDSYIPKTKAHLIEGLNTLIAKGEYMKINEIARYYCTNTSRENAVDGIRAAVACLVDCIIETKKKLDGVKNTMNIYEEAVKNQGCRLEIILEKFKTEQSKNMSLSRMLYTTNTKRNHTSFRQRGSNSVYHTTLDLSAL